MCKHEFVKTTGKKSKKVTWYCLHCPETRVEEVRPVSKVFTYEKRKTNLKNPAGNQESGI